MSGKIIRSLAKAHLLIYAIDLYAIHVGQVLVRMGLFVSNEQDCKGKFVTFLLILWLEIPFKSFIIFHQLPKIRLHLLHFHSFLLHAIDLLCCVTLFQ